MAAAHSVAGRRRLAAVARPGTGGTRETGLPVRRHPAEMQRGVEELLAEEPEQAAPRDRRSRTGADANERG